VIPASSAYPQVLHDSIYIPIDSARRAAALRAIAVRDSIARDSALAAARDTASVPDTTRQVRPVDRDRVTEPRAEPPRRPGRAGQDADTLEADRPTQVRPRIGNRLMVRLNGYLEPGQRYSVEVRGVRALSGTVADTLRGILTTREAPPPAPPRQ
jgi:hypothetical protein